MFSNSNKKIFFITDASNKIGLGHYTRCLAIAEIVENSYRINFVLNKNNTPGNFIESYQYPTYFIDEENEILELLVADDIVVVDSYLFNENFQSKLNSRLVKLIVIDDLNNMVYDCNAIINHGVLFKSHDYKLINLKTKLYLGLDYLMVRKEFRYFSNKKIVRKSIHNFDNVFICFGGSDQSILINSTIKVLAQCGVQKFSILTGKEYDFSLSNEIKNVVVNTYNNLSPTFIIKLIENSDFALLPASTILLEAFTVGIPIISGWFVENQKFSLEIFEELGMIINLNNFKSINYKSNLKNAFDRLKKADNLALNQKKSVKLNEENYLKIFNEIESIY